MELKEKVRVKQGFADHQVVDNRLNSNAQPESLSGEEKKIFDAAFVGLIVGAGLTALLFAFM